MASRRQGKPLAIPDARDAVSSIHITFVSVAASGTHSWLRAATAPQTSQAVRYRSALMPQARVLGQTCRVMAA